MNRKLSHFFVAAAFIFIIYAGFQYVSANKFIHEGDSLLTGGHLKEAEKVYQKAEEILDMPCFRHIPFFKEMKAKTCLRLAMAGRLAGNGSEYVRIYMDKAMDSYPDIFYGDMQDIASLLGVRLKDEDILLFRDIEFHKILPGFLKKDSPLHHSKITVKGGHRAVDIEIVYNHKDLQPTSKDATTTYHSTGSLKRDIIRDMTRMVNTITDFAKERKSEHQLRFVYIMCRHGVQISTSNLPFSSTSRDMVIYATRTDIKKVANNGTATNLQQLWQVTTDAFPTLFIRSSY